MQLITFLSTFLPASLLIWSISIFFSNSSNEVTQLRSPLRWLLSISIPTLLAFRGFRKKSLSFSGFIVGLILGFILTLSNYCFTSSLLVFFITSSMATNYKSEKKRNLEEYHREGGQRNWVQVVCNGGIATELSIIYLMEKGSGESPIDFINDYNGSWFAISVLGAISCANGDTWASELGAVVSKANPFLITSLKRVPKGTNGGVSVIGLAVSALGGIAVAFGFLVLLMVCANSEDLRRSPPQWPILIVGLFGGLFGSVIDSLLGATLQYSGFDERTRKVVENPGSHIKHICGLKLFDNHSVNLLSTLITAIVSPYFAIRFWNYFY